VLRGEIDKAGRLKVSSGEARNAPQEAARVIMDFEKNLRGLPPVGRSCFSASS